MENAPPARMRKFIFVVNCDEGKGEYSIMATGGGVYTSKELEERKANKYNCLTHALGKDYGIFYNDQFILEEEWSGACQLGEGYSVHTYINFNDSYWTYKEGSIFSFVNNIRIPYTISVELKNGRNLTVYSHKGLRGDGYGVPRAEKLTISSADRLVKMCSLGGRSSCFDAKGGGISFADLENRPVYTRHRLITEIVDGGVK